MDDLDLINIVLLFGSSNEQRDLSETAEVNPISQDRHTHSALHIRTCIYRHTTKT